MLIVLFRLIPISWAAPMSSETALMALPIFVLFTIMVRTTIEMTDTTIVTMAA